MVTGTGLDSEICEHGTHEGSLRKRPTEGRPMDGMVCCMLCAEPHEGCGSNRAVEPRVYDHLDDRTHTFAWRAEEHTPRVVVFDFTRSVGSVAQLVLETHDT
jgi:hypothetical protein